MTTDLQRNFELECKKHSRSKKDFEKYFIVDDGHINEGINKEPIRAGVARHEVIRRIIQDGVLCWNKCKDNPTEIVLALKFINYSWTDQNTFKEVSEQDPVVAYVIVRDVRKHFIVTVRVDTKDELKTIEIPEVNYEE